MIFNQVRPLFKTPYIFYFGITCYMQICTFLAGGAVSLWFVYLSNQISKSSLTHGTLCDVLRKSIHESQVSIPDNKTSNTVICDDTISDKTIYDSIMLGVYLTIIMVLITIFVQRVGRGVIMMISAFGASLAGYLILWIQNLTVSIVLCSLLVVLPNSMLSVISGSSVNLFPTSVRTTAICLMLMCGRLTSTIGSSVIGLTIQSHCEETFFTVTTIILGSGFLNFVLPWKFR